MSALCAGDLGRFALQKTWVTYAASAGAEYAVAHGFKASAIATAATSAAPVPIPAVRSGSSAVVCSPPHGSQPFDLG